MLSPHLLVIAAVCCCCCWHTAYGRYLTLSFSSVAAWFYTGSLSEDLSTPNPSTTVAASAAKVGGGSWTSSTDASPSSSVTGGGGGAGTTDVVDGWISLAGLSLSSPVQQQYLAAYYWAITTVSTVGYGDISAHTTQERLFSIFSSLVGCMGFGTLACLLADSSN